MASLLLGGLFEELGGVVFDRKETEKEKGN